MGEIQVRGYWRSLSLSKVTDILRNGLSGLYILEGPGFPALEEDILAETGISGNKKSHSGDPCAETHQGGWGSDMEQGDVLLSVSLQLFRHKHLIKKTTCPEIPNSQKGSQRQSSLA